MERLIKLEKYDWSIHIHCNNSIFYYVKNDFYPIYQLYTIYVFIILYIKIILFIIYSLFIFTLK